MSKTEESAARRRDRQLGELFWGQHGRLHLPEFYQHWQGSLPRAWLASKVGCDSVEHLIAIYGEAEDVTKLGPGRWVLPEGAV